MATFIRPLCGLFTVATTLTLSACGGGGGSNNSGAPTPGTPTVERYAFVTSLNQDTLSSYAVDADTGLMQLVDKHPSINNAIAVAMRPGHDEVIALGSGGLYHYALDSRGDLDVVTTLPGGSDMRKLVIHPSGETLYVADFSDMGIYQFTFDEWGELVEIDPEHFVGPDYLGAGFADLAMRSNGNQVYAADLSQDNISRFDVGNDGALTYVDSIDAGDGPWRMAQHKGTKTLYAINRHDGTLSQYRIQADGSLVSLGLADDGLGNIFEVGQLEGITLDNSGRFVYVSDLTNDKIWEFRITNDGTLEPLPGFAIGVEADVSPGNLIASPVSDRIYLADSNAGALLAFAIGDDGTLSPMTPDRLAVDARPTDMVFSTGKPLTAHSQAAYVINGIDDDISQFLMDDSGTLTPLGDSNPTTGDFPTALATHPSGRYLYVANLNDDTVSQYRRVMSTQVNLEKDELSPIQSPISADLKPAALAVHPSGNFLYVVSRQNQSLSVYNIQANGEIEDNNGIGVYTPDDPLLVDQKQIGVLDPTALAIDPTGRFLWVVNDKDPGFVILFRIDTSDGTITKIDAASKPAGKNPRAITVGRDGRAVYIAAATDNEVRTYSVADDGALTLVENVPADQSPVNVLVSQAGNALYAVNTVSSNVSQFSIAPDTSTLSAMNPASQHSGTGPQGIAMAPTARHLLVTNSAEGNLTRFSVANSGALGAGENIETGLSPQGVAVVGYTE